MRSPTPLSTLLPPTRTRNPTNPTAAICVLAPSRIRERSACCCYWWWCRWGRFCSDHCTSMPMAARAATSLLLPLLLSLPLLLASISCRASPDGGPRRNLLAYVPARKRAASGGGGGADCRAMASRSECLERSEWCRWCRSDALDDMCFGSAEAWRLPRQIFSCETPGA